ncbi:MAG: tRNA pseudouridine(55) synthase TruB [Candidatus Buchananbacteria bacterium]
MIIAVNKPKGPSSFKIVAKIRRLTGIKRVGHAGTLDPLASGVLVVAIGRKSTREIGELIVKDKEYIAKIKLGYLSSTDDGEGVKTKISGGKPTLTDIKKEIKRFIGKIDQVPPQFSAIKIGGKRAYKMARAGDVVYLKSRPVFIKDIKILNYKYPNLEISVECGSGVYIRSLARDIGNSLKVGGYMSGLIRTRVGQYAIGDCISLSAVKMIMKWDDALHELKAGQVAVMPTDTIYGLLGQALNKKTVERIYKLKKRAPDKPAIILISSIEDIKLFGIKLTKEENEVVNNLWPGKVSIVLPCKSKKNSYLHRGTNTLAFRLPKKKDLILLLKQTGPLIAPSANPEGFSPAKSIKQAKNYFNNDVDLYIAGRSNSEPSTLVKIEKGKLIILRTGAVKISL